MDRRTRTLRELPKVAKRSAKSLRMWISVPRPRKLWGRRRRDVNVLQTGSNKWRTGERYWIHRLLSGSTFYEECVCMLAVIVWHCFPGNCYRGWAVPSDLLYHHQAGPGSGWGDQRATRASAQEPGDETEASPGGRSVCALCSYSTWLHLQYIWIWMLKWDYELN